MQGEPIADIHFIGRTTAARLLDHGYRSTDDLREASAEELVEIEGIGIGKAIRLIDVEREPEAIVQ